MHPARTRTELSFPAWPEQNLPLLVQVANGSECRDGGYPRIRGQLFSILPLSGLGCSLRHTLFSRSLQSPEQEWRLAHVETPSPLWPIQL